jgi:hypothetical protein
MIRMLNSQLFSALGLDFNTLFMLLGRISECPHVVSEDRARAMAMRAVRTFGWESGQVLEEYWSPSDQSVVSSATLRLKVLEEIETAIHLNTNVGGEGSAFLHFTLALMNRAFRTPFEMAYEEGLNARKGTSNHDDLLSNMIFTYLTTRVAIDRKIPKTIRSMIRITDQYKQIGEWGMLFSDWWSTLEDNFARHDVYRKEWQILNHETWESDIALFNEQKCDP